MAFVTTRTMRTRSRPSRQSAKGVNVTTTPLEGHKIHIHGPASRGGQAAGAGAGRVLARPAPRPTANSAA